MPKEKAPAPDAAINELLAFFDKLSGNERAYAANLAAIGRVIREDFHFPLSEPDRVGLAYVYEHFHNRGLNIAYRAGGSWGSYFPTLKDLITETDLQGKLSNFLASREDYDFVRSLHRRNLIIPVVGDFAGKKALAAVGNYLRESGFTVAAFYTSNVERYLFGGGSFTAFGNNVRRLPINDRSLFIRSVSAGYSHPARLPGHRSATLLQQMTVFLRDFDEGRYQSYRDVATTHYIVAEKPFRR